MQNIKFIVIPDVAINKLHLSGNALVLYGLIYTHTQESIDFDDDGKEIVIKHWFSMPTRDLAKLLDISPTTVNKILNDLCKRGLLEKETKKVGLVNHCKYRTIDVDAPNTAQSPVSVTDIELENDGKNFDDLSCNRNCNTCIKNCNTCIKNCNACIKNCNAYGIENPNDSNNDSIKNCNHENPNDSENLHYNNIYNNIYNKNNKNNIYNKYSDPNGSSTSTKPSKTLLSVTKTSTKTKNWITAKSRILNSYDFSDRVHNEILAFFQSLVESNALLPDVSVRAQLDELCKLSEENQYNAVHETIVRGWKSLSYMIRDISSHSRPRFDTATKSVPQLKDPNNDRRLEQYKGEELF